MDNKKLQEFLKKVEAQSAVARTSALDEINADNGIQTMSETGLEEGLEVRYSEGNADIIANSVEYRNNFKFEDKFIETFNVTGSRVYGGGATYIDKNCNIGVIIDYDAFLQTCMLAETDVISCKVALCGKNRASKIVSVYPLDSNIKICDIEQEGGFYKVDLLTVKEACGSYDFRLADPDLRDSLEPSRMQLIINGGMMTVTDFTIRNKEKPQKNVQAIIDNAVEFKKRYRSKDKFVTIFNVDENGVFGNGDFIDFDTDIAVLADYEELVYSYGLKPSEVTSCRLVLFGKTKAWHGCNLYPLDSAKKFCEVVQEDNNVYSIDLKSLYEHKRSADFRLGDPNLMDSFDTDMVKIVINGANMITITDFSRAAVGGEFKDNIAILKSAESFRKNYKFTDGFIKLFDTDGSELYAEDDFLTANDTTDLIGILDYEKLLFSLGYRISDVQSFQLRLHGRVPTAGRYNLYSLDTREYVAEVSRDGFYKAVVDLKHLYEKYGNADFILEKAEFVESFVLWLSTVEINGKSYNLLNLYDNTGGYKDGENAFKNINLAGGAELNLNLSNGSAAPVFGSVNADDFVIPVNISHVRTEAGGDSGYGRGWRLNLNRKLNVAEEDTAATTVYTFTDETGKNHTFTETYYYIENGEKRFVSKNSVMVDLNGNLTYGDNEVKKQQSCGGYTLIPEVNDYVDSEFIDQRLGEQAELEDYVKSLERSLKEYVKVNSANGEITYAMPALNKSGYRQLISGVTQTSDACVMTESEALQLQSLYANKEQLTKQSAQIDFQKRQLDLQKRQIDLQKKQLDLRNNQIGQQISDLEHTKGLSTKLCTNINSNSDFVFQSAEAFFNNITLSGFEDAQLPELREKMSYKSAVKNLELLDSENATMVDQRNFAAKQLLLVAEQKLMLAEQAETLNEQLGFVNTQIGYIISQARKNLDSVKDAFKKYFGKKAQLDYTLLHTPVNYLKDGNGLISGFSGAGDLVCIFDTYGNSVAVEYDKKARISGLHDSNGKAVSFKYSGGKLKSITDNRGRTVKYGYADGNLTSVLFTDGSTLNFAYDGEKFVSAISNDTVCGQIAYADGKVSAVKTLSKPVTIEKNMTENEESDYTEVLSSVTVEYTNTDVTLNYHDGAKEIYVFSSVGRLTSCTKIDNLGFETLTKFMPNGTPADTFVTLTRKSDTENEFTINVYDNAMEKPLKEFSWAEISENHTIKAYKTYIYDGDDRIISETAEKITILNGEEEKTTAVVNYHYGANGNLILTESKICGEEQTTGVNFTERTYDKNGNVTKTVSWNSLDASSKFYTQNDVAENGQVTAERDETGEVSAEYEYVEGTNIVNSVTHANGSKLSYGRNPFNFNVNSITQSTAEGEANTTDMLYEHGLPVEVKSGNTVINYAYDCHGRKTSVTVNGGLQSAYTYSDYEYDEETDKTLFGAATATEYVDDTETVTYYSEKTAVTDEATGRKKVTEAYNINGEEVLVKNYDANNNITDISDFKAGTFTEFTYDEHKRFTAVETAKNGESCLTERYTYNVNGELTGMQIDGGLELSYTYAYRDTSARTLDNINVNETLDFKPLTDVNGRNMGKEVFISKNKLCGEYISYRKIGDRATNMPATVWFANGANIRESLRYKYDRCGNIAQITQNGDKAVSYEYDSLNRLERENNKLLNKTVIFTYNTNGNIANRCEYPYTVKSGEELSELTCKHFDYMYEGDRLVKILSDSGEETFAYNNLGSPTTYRNKQLQWQYGKLLTKYGDTTFEYDGSGRRIKKSKIEYIYDSAGKLVSSSDGTTYIYDDKGVAGFINADGMYLYRKDAQGNIIAILDSAGAVVVRYVYDAWGNHKVLDANGQEITDPKHIGNVNPYRYRGYFYDVETGLYYLQTRYYDPSIGRFISQDSIEYADPQSINGLNLYAYCNNNPVMGYDPDGTINWKEFWSKVGRFFAGVFAVIRGVQLTVASFAASFFMPILGTIGFEAGLSLFTYGVGLVGSVFNGQIEKDMIAIGWNPFNSDANAVVGSGIMSFYKGVPIFRTNNSRSGTFGIMLLASGETENVVKHEFGHVPQLLLLGPVKFLITVGLPSYKEWGLKKYWNDYYLSPWEAMADMFGGVQNTPNPLTAAEKARAIKYLVASYFLGPFVLPFYHSF